MAGKSQTVSVKKKTKQYKKREPNKNINKKKKRKTKNKERPRRVCHTLAVLSVGLRSHAFLFSWQFTVKILLNREIGSGLQPLKNDKMRRFVLLSNRPSPRSFQNHEQKEHRP